MNIKQFSEKIGVSTATVSRAFGTNGRISVETRRRILSQAKAYGYSANYHARNLIRNKIHTVAFFHSMIAKGIPDYFITEIMFGVSCAASQGKLPLQIHLLSPESMEFCKDIVLNGSISGIIVIAGSPESLELVGTARNCGLPYVVIGHMEGERENSVLFDGERGARLAGKHLKDSGRKFPAYVGGLFDRRKREGFAKGLGRLSSRLVFDEGGSTFDDGATAFARLMEKSPSIDSVLCANDTLAIGFIRSALSNGIEIPKQISVVGFDDINVSRYFTPPLTTIRLNLDGIGQKSLSLLIRKLNGEKPQTGEYVECELVKRDSA